MTHSVNEVSRDMNSETLSAIRAIVEEWNNGQCSLWAAMHSINAIASIIESAAIAVQPPAASQLSEKVWPFAESPGDFTKRLLNAYNDFDGNLLSAVRYVLIENPARLAVQPPAASEPCKIQIPPAPADMADVIYAEGWNACCEEFFGGKPAQEPLVITVTEYPAASQLSDTVKRWCETCEGDGYVFQEPQAGCHVGGDHPCPDCDGKGYWVSAQPPAASQPVAAPTPVTDEQIQSLWDVACEASPKTPAWNRHIRFARAVLDLAAVQGKK